MYFLITYQQVVRQINDKQLQQQMKNEASGMKLPTSSKKRVNLTHIFISVPLKSFDQKVRFE